MPERPRILIVKMSSLGDHFHALPAVRMLKRNFGGVIDWVTQPEYVRLVGCFEDVDRVHAFPRRSFLSRLPSFAARLRVEEYDCVIDLQGLLKSALAAWMARSPIRIGPSYAREGSRLFYTACAGRCNKERHAVDEALDVIRFLGLPVGKPEFPVRFPRKRREEARPLIGMLPRSRWETKNWPVESFIEAGRILLEETGGTILLLGSPADRGVCARIADEVGKGVMNLCGKTSLCELGRVLREADVLLSVDSGPMHMAAALGVPVVAVFGATDPVRTGPYGEEHRVLTERDLDCRPCFSEDCAREDLACLRRIEPSRVVAQVLEVLSERGRAAAK